MARNRSGSLGEGKVYRSGFSVHPSYEVPDAELSIGLFEVEVAVGSEHRVAGVPEGNGVSQLPFAFATCG